MNYEALYDAIKEHCIEKMEVEVILPSQRLQDALRPKLGAYGLDLEEALFFNSQVFDDLSDRLSTPEPALSKEIKRVFSENPELRAEFDRSVVLTDAETDYFTEKVRSELSALKYSQEAKHTNASTQHTNHPLYQAYIDNGVGPHEAKEGVRAFDALIQESIAAEVGQGVRRA